MTLGPTIGRHQPVAETQPTGALARLETCGRVAEEIHDLLGQLESRLEGVLMPSNNPPETEGVGPVEAIRSPIVVTLDNHQAHLQAACGHLQQLIGRLEV